MRTEVIRFIQKVKKTFAVNLQNKEFSVQWEVQPVIVPVKNKPHIYR